MNSRPALFHSALRTHHSAFEVSVAGLAPARVGLKIRLRELLCIHGQKNGVMEYWSFGVLVCNTPSLRHPITPLTARFARLVSEERPERRDDGHESGSYEVTDHCLDVFVGGGRFFVE